MLKEFVKIATIISIGVIVLPTISFAQTNMGTSYSLANELGVEIIPNYPRPEEEVSINLTLYTNDLNSADISWYNNDTLVLNGKGKTAYSFRTGLVGEEVKIEIRIKLLGGSTFSKIIVLTPASVDLVWEANSYVTPFYKGKALHSRQGILKVVAMPEFVKNGKRIPPENLIYQWSNGVSSYQSQSGYGKNTLILNGSILGRSESIDVLVTDPATNLVAEGFLDVSPVDPQIVFYQNDPYYGHIFDLATNGSFDLKTEEVQIVAAPYYFTKENEGNLKYEWLLNGRLITDLLNSRTAVFRKPENEAGRSAISLRMENQNRILQQAEKSLIINFDE